MSISVGEIGEICACVAPAPTKVLCKAHSTRGLVSSRVGRLRVHRVLNGPFMGEMWYLPDLPIVVLFSLNMLVVIHLKSKC